MSAWRAALTLAPPRPAPPASLSHTRTHPPPRLQILIAAAAAALAAPAAAFTPPTPVPTTKPVVAEKVALLAKLEEAAAAIKKEAWEAASHKVHAVEELLTHKATKPVKPEPHA